jgi:hypothetical protein
MAAFLLALAACGQAPTAAPPAGNGSPALPMPPVQNESGSPPTMPAPAQSTGQIGAEPAPNEGGGPRDRFVVCPGSPRCPPDGSEPKGR